MRPVPWNPPIELSSSEQQVAKQIRKAKLFLLLSPTSSTSIGYNFIGLHRCIR